MILNYKQNIVEASNKVEKVLDNSNLIVYTRSLSLHKAVELRNIFLKFSRNIFS